MTRRGRWIFGVTTVIYGILLFTYIKSFQIIPFLGGQLGGLYVYNSIMRQGLRPIWMIAAVAAAFVPVVVQRWLDLVVFAGNKSLYQDFGTGILSVIGGLIWGWYWNRMISQTGADGTSSLADR